MKMCSDIIKGEQASNLWSGSEYNDNNSWIFNATNGTLNNNNKMNSNGVRGSLEFDGEEDRLRQFFSIFSQYIDEETLRKFLALYASYLDDYRVMRKHKRGKTSQLVFEYNLQREMLSLCWSIFNREYVPLPSNNFIIPSPTLREVIAAMCRDRIPQTRVVRRMMPLLEKRFFLKDSYSCRVGKGGLAAVKQLMEYIKKETRLYTRPAYIFKFDIRSFFMSIDVMLFFPVFVDLVKKYMPDNEERDELLYLSRIIYQSLPQNHCRKKGNPELRRALPPGKSLEGRLGQGMPIGNVTSQMFCLIVTTFILLILERFGILSVLYTDDDCGVVCDKENFMRFYSYLKMEVRSSCHLEIHPKKFYLQYYKKTVNLLGFKIKYGRLLLPGDRMVHNFIWKITCAIRKSEEYENYIYKAKEGFVSVMCSYLGLLKHTASYNLRKQQMERLMASKWNIVLEFDTENYYKVRIRDKYTLKSYYKLRNKKRKQQLKSYYHELTGIAA